MWLCRRTVPASERGFSLVELFLVLSLLTVFMGAIYETVIVGLRVAGGADTRENLRRQLAGALDRVTREGSLASNVDNAEGQRFQFDADLDGDGNTENNINYQVTGGALQRTYSGTTVTLIASTALPSPPAFNYTDLNGADMGTPVSSGNRHNIRVVRVTATVSSGNETISMTTAAYLRNNR